MRSAIFLLLCLPIAASAGVYKCTVNGRVSYQDQPCAGESERIDVKVAPPIGTSAPASSTNDWLQQADLDDKRREIERLQADNRKYQAAMDSELDALRTKKAATGNRIEGALISRDMDDVIMKYRPKMYSNEERIYALQRQLSAKH